MSNEEILNPFNKVITELIDNIKIDTKLNDDGSITMSMSFDADHLRNLIKELYIGAVLKADLTREEIHRYSHLIATLTEPKA